MRKSVRILEISLAVLLLFMPLLLRLIDGTWRDSISDYAYSNYSYCYVFLLTLAGTTFVYNGVGYNRHWYNIILGISLYGIALSPHKDYYFIHFASATIFFAGSILAISLSSSILFKTFKYIVSAIIATALILHLQFNLFSLLTAEFIGIIPIATHFIIKSLKY
jgi:hypothetical membrane protein